MKNREFYRDQIMNEKYEYTGENCFCCKFVKPYVLKTSDCDGLQCTQCHMIQDVWLEEEYEEPEVDWSQVAVDTPVLVSNDGKNWNKRYFEQCNNGYVYAYVDGSTSWSNGCGSAPWRYAKLAEVNE